MDYGLYLSTAGALVQDMRADQVANNLANVSTAGFRRVLQTFQERKPESFEDPAEVSWQTDPIDGVGGGLFLYRTLYDRSPGPLIATGNPLDLAIQGDGYFAVRAPDSDEVLFTRAGNFRVGPDGILHTADGGHAVLDENGSEIEVADPASDTFAESIQVRVFPEDADRTPVGGALYRFDGEGEAFPASGRVLSGAIEQSSVHVVTEMIEMIEALRAYEANASMIRGQNDTLSRAVNEIARSPR
ncbi:MAG: flagellar hook-basal body protein [Planctomycetes bacterium]|nr:flagellar hook-basal body protein [Planctomycetota bacterium]